MSVERAVTTTSISGLLVVDVKAVADERGTVREVFRASDWPDAPFGSWRQVNLTTTRRGAIRGLHGESMTKLVGVAAGAAHGVYVDVREGEGFGRVETVDLVVGREVLVPAGVCNGFQALTDDCVYLYCFDDEWRPDMPGRSVCPLDPELGIRWPIEIDADDPALLSRKDRDAPPLRAA